MRKSSETEPNETDIITGRNKKVQTRTVVLSNVNVPSTASRLTWDSAGRRSRWRTRGKIRQERFDRTQRAEDRDRF